MRNDTVFIENVGQVMYGVAVLGAVMMLAGTVIVISGGVALFKILR